MKGMNPKFLFLKTRDLSKFSFGKLINALQVVDQRRNMRQEETEWVVDVVYLAKEPKEKEKKFFSVIIAKNLYVKRKNAGTRESLNASNVEDLGIYKNIVE